MAHGVLLDAMIDDFGRVHGVKSTRLRYFNATGAEPTAEIGENHNSETLFR